MRMGGIRRRNRHRIHNRIYDRNNGDNWKIRIYRYNRNGTYSFFKLFF